MGDHLFAMGPGFGSGAVQKQARGQPSQIERWGSIGQDDTHAQTYLLIKAGGRVNNEFQSEHWTWFYTSISGCTYEKFKLGCFLTLFYNTAQLF